METVHPACSRRGVAGSRRRQDANKGAAIAGIEEDPSAESYSFARIAGGPATERGATPRKQLDPLLEAIAILTNWRKRGSYRCHSTLTLGDSHTAFELEVRPGMNSYRSVRVPDGLIDSFDGASGVRIVGNREEAVSANQIATEPLQLRLSFPLSLGVWGRPGDSYRFSGARDLGDDIAVDLVHQHEASVKGTLDVSRQLRIAVRLDTPTVSCHYRNIEPLSDRF